MSSVEDLVQRMVEEMEAKKKAKSRLSSQAEKSTTGLAGEFYVAAELLRREIHATVTFGNAKSADVLAMHLTSNRFVRIEVKTSRRGKGSALVGSGKIEAIRAMTDSPDLLWVLCVLPKHGDEAGHPDFYILKSSELKAMVLERAEEYEKKIGKPYLSDGVWTIKFVDLEQTDAKGAWHKVSDALAQLVSD